MSAPRVVSVAAGSAAQRAGVQVGDELIDIDGQVPRDVIEYRLLVDEPEPEITIRRGHEELVLRVPKAAGEALGAEVSSALFDRVRTCDNHCEFCFIYQLPKGMRRSLYLKDDDYRLSFLYGNFTTLTRFTEMDLERIVDERLSPLFVSIHSTDPELRAHMLRNPRGAVSLRWLRALLDAGMEVHGQVVVCPGVNDGEALERTLTDVLDEYHDLATVAVVPLGLSRFSTESAMRPHSTEEARAVLDTVHRFQAEALDLFGRRLVYASDEYYLMAGVAFPPASDYDGFPQHENGIGMARAFEAAFAGDGGAAYGVKPGFFAWVDGAPAAGYRAQRSPDRHTERDSDDSGGPGSAVVVVTGEFGAAVLQPLLDHWSSTRIDGAGAVAKVELLVIANDFFGGTIGVTGLLTGADVARALTRVPAGARVLLPDVCLSEGRFLDGMTLEELGRPVEVVRTDGLSLRLALNADGVSTPAATRVPVQVGRR
ncbi:MAG: DUF512 domain-containing protein [Acidimicrobiales bacterium]